MLTRQEIFNKVVKHFENTINEKGFFESLPSRYFHDSGNPCCGIGAVIKDYSSKVMESDLRIPGDVFDIPANISSVRSLCENCSEIHELLNYSENGVFLKELQYISDYVPSVDILERCKRIASKYGLEMPDVN